MQPRVPPLGPNIPSRGNAVSRAIGRAALAAAGWRIEGRFPDEPKLVVVVAPHTSNWDFLVGVAAMFALGLRATFLGKDTLFRWPLGIVMRWLGGFPVDRKSPHNVVAQTIALVRSQDRILLGLSPEGSRSKQPAWRTGYHYVARGANIPIVPVAFDYPARTIRVFPVHAARETPEEDATVLGRLFHPRMARHPDQY